MSRRDWAYVSGLLNAQRQRLMDRRDVLDVLDAADAEVRASHLHAGVLFPEPLPEGALTDAVNAAFERFVRRTADLCPDGRIADLFLMEREWEAFRRFAKRRLAEAGLPESTASDRESDDAPEWLRRCWAGEVEEERFKPFAEAAGRIRSDAPSDGDVAGWVDRACDAFQAAALIETARALNSPMLLEWVEFRARLGAGMALVRAHGMGWPPTDVLAHWEAAGLADDALRDLARDEDPSIKDLLRKLGLPLALVGSSGQDEAAPSAAMVDAVIADRSREAMGVPFGPEPVFAFLWALRCEATNLRLALAAAEYGIPRERIERELRANHG